MTRTTAAPPGPQLNDDEFYLGALKPGFKIEKSKVEGWDPQLMVEWELKQGATIRDYISLRLGTATNGKPAKLRQLLNALAEKPKDAELWFDSDTLEWGYDMAPEAPAWGVLTEGLAVQFRGALRPAGKDGIRRYRIDGYRSA